MLKVYICSIWIRVLFLKGIGVQVAIAKKLETGANEYVRHQHHPVRRHHLPRRNPAKITRPPPTERRYADTVC